MFIKQKSIRSADRFLKNLLPGNKIRITATADPNNDPLKIGFSGCPTDGETVLPKPAGPISTFNADGKFVTRKDQPKESRYITTIEWTWEQWSGRGSTESVTENRDIFRDCYPREFSSPPCEEVSWITHEGNKLITSREFEVANLDKNELIHCINLFLELFGECEIRRADLSSFLPFKVARLNWRLLPPGEYPWPRVRTHTERLVADKNARYSNVILGRQELITKYSPEEVFIGNGGFRTYIAYVFKVKNIVVLESVMTDNATYIFGDDWKEVSTLTKAQILTGNLQKDRVVHSKGWEDRISTLLG